MAYFLGGAITMITDEQYYCISDRAHFLFGNFIIFAVYIFTEHFSWTHWAVIGSWVVLLGWAAWKEFKWDVENETDEVAGGEDGGRRDFMGYVCGSLTAVLLCWLQHVLTHLN